MQQRPDPAEDVALAPLLASIGREVAERCARLETLEARIAGLRASPFYTAELGVLQAESALQRRELRRCRAELERLGCSVVATAPLTVRIPQRGGGPRTGRTWRHGQTSNN